MADTDKTVIVFYEKVPTCSLGKPDVRNVVISQLW